MDDGSRSVVEKWKLRASSLPNPREKLEELKLRAKKIAAKVNGKR